MNQVETFSSGMHQTRSLYSPGDKSAPEDRRLINWPLEDVNLDVPAVMSDFTDGSPWPNPRATRRNQKLGVYADLYRGKFSHFVKDETAAVVKSNYFSRVSEIMSALMVSSLDESEYDMSDTIMTSIVDIMRYGRSYLWTGEDGELLPADTRNCFTDGEDDEGLFIVTPYASLDSQDGTNDSALVYYVHPTLGSTWTQGLKDGKFTTDPQDVADLAGDWQAIDRPPVIDNWGTSAFDQLIPLVVNLALRLTGIQNTLSANESPTVIFPFAEADAPKLVGLRGDPQNISQFGRPEINRAVKGIRDNDRIWVPNGNFSPTTISWDGAMPASFQMVDILKAELRMMTGIPAALEQEGGDVPSGAALREMFLVLYWIGEQLHNRLVRGLADILNRDVAWPSPFENNETTTVLDPALETELDAVIDETII